MRPFDRSTIRWFAVGAVLLAIGVPLLAVQGQDVAADWHVGAVRGLADAGLETGFPDGSYLAADPLTGYQAAVLIDRLLERVATRTGCAAPTPAAGGFVDVPGDHWAAGSVAQIAALGVADAFPEGRFDGDATLTGFQTALLVARALASAEEQVACSEQAVAQALADLRAEVGELRSAIADGSHAGTAGAAGLVGQPGPAGAPGPAGPPGPAGTAGSAGADGVAGLAGEAGPRGLDGPVGLAGTVGAIGPVGPVGPAGADGQSGAGGHACWDLDGDGLPGLEEDVNLDGVWDALDCAGTVGPAGASGEAGAMGPQGPTGATGPQGLQGPQGEVGPQGEIGLMGPQGPQGEPGPPGRPGRDDDKDDDDDGKDDDDDGKDDDDDDDDD